MIDRFLDWRSMYWIVLLFFGLCVLDCFCFDMQRKFFFFGNKDEFVLFWSGLFLGIFKVVQFRVEFGF